jgi:hypothetical protein
MEQCWRVVLWAAGIIRELFPEQLLHCPIFLFSFFSLNFTPWIFVAAYPLCTHVWVRMMLSLSSFCCLPCPSDESRFLPLQVNWI